ncbi:MAG: MBL fold metallo-hydrolase [Alphaproteobacteria bacterium]|nr:MBL fold metallo-hydrolase [Alphaproteobacteria bacterium]
MPPTLHVLGVAQDGGHPQAGCERPCCAPAWADPRRGHRAACLGLVAEGRGWLLDATPDLPRQLHALREAGAAELAGVLLTHAHSGHYTGLMHLGREAMNARGLPVYAMPRMKRFLEGHGPWSQLVKLGNIDLIELIEGLPVSLAPGLSARAFAVPHREEFSEVVGFHVQGPERSALYLPDIDKWERWARPVEAALAEVDLAFVDGTFHGPGELPGRDPEEVPHPFMQESLARLGALPESERRKLRFIHLNHTNPCLDPESPESRALAEAGFAVAQEGARHGL